MDKKIVSKFVYDNVEFSIVLCIVGDNCSIQSGCLF